jgi:putative ABC transport system permease protein
MSKSVFDHTLQCIYHFRLRLRTLLLPRKVERDLEDELSFHLAMQAQANAKASMSLQKAEQAARRQFGGLTQHQEACRDQIYGLTETAARLLGAGLKTLLREKAYLFAIVVMALAIGISTAVFSLAQTVIFHPLPFPNQQSLRVIWKGDSRAGNPFLELAYPELSDLQQGVSAFESVALMPTTLYGYGKVIRIGSQEPVQVESAPVSHGFFKTLGVRPVLGRDFNASDEHPGAAPVVILSNSVWRTQFHQDAQIIGRQVTLNMTGYTVIGVAARDVDFPKGVGVWVPLGVSKDVDNRNAYFLLAIARVKAGYSAEQADSQVKALFQEMARAYPQFYSATQEPVITPLPQYWMGSARLQLLVSLGASFLLLLTGCITASNLFLSRTLARRQEIATRSSLGATPLQILAQFFTEGLLAAFFSGFIGVVTAWVMIKLLVHVAPPDIPRLEDAGVNWQALGFAIIVSLLGAIACSAASMLVATRMNLESGLREGGPRLTSARRGNRIQISFIVIQTAASVILLVASCLIVISVRVMLRNDVGFSHLDTVTMNLALRGSQDDSIKRRLFYTNLLNRLRESSAVIDAGAVLVRPLEGTIGWDMPFRTEFDRARSSEQLPVSNFEVITPGYFQTVGTPILEGRDFTNQDRENTQKAVIVSNGLANRMRASGHEPIGTRIRFGKRDDGTWWTIVGVTGNTRYRGVAARDEDIYVCYLQVRLPVNYLVLRGRAPANELTALVRREVAALDPSQAIANAATIGELLRRNTARQRFNMALLLSFGLTSLLLTAAGIYSVIAEMVSLRTREIAIRLALGSDRSILVRRFIGRTMGFVLLGEMVGLLAFLVLGRAVSSLLYSIQPEDPFVLSVVLSSVLIVSAAAASVPAWIASGQNPRSILQ